LQQVSSRRLEVGDVSAEEAPKLGLVEKRKASALAPRVNISLSAKLSTTLLTTRPIMMFFEVFLFHVRASVPLGGKFSRLELTVQEIEEATVSMPMVSTME